jgi:hypothetical protein
MLHGLLFFQHVLLQQAAGQDLRRQDLAMQRIQQPTGIQFQEKE